MTRNSESYDRFDDDRLVDRERAHMERGLQVIDSQPINRGKHGLRRLSTKRRAQLAQRRTEVAEDYLVRGVNANETARRIARIEGCCLRTAERAVSHARERIARKLADTRDEQLSRSLVFYLWIAADKTNSVHDRIAARQRVDALLGLDAPGHQYAEADTTMLDADSLLKIVRQHFPEATCSPAGTAGI